MVGLIGIIASFFTSTVATATANITIETVKVLIWKAFLLFLVVVVTPIMLYNVLGDFLFDLILYGVNYISGLDIQPITIQLTGIAGYIGSQIGIHDIVAAYMTAVATRFNLAILRIL